METIIKIKNHRFFWPILLTIITFILLYYKVTARTLWMDETAVLQYSEVGPWQFLLNYFRVPDNHPPLYYLLVNSLYHLVPAHSVAVIRTVSILAGAGIIVTIYYFILLLFKEKLLAVAGALLATTSAYFVLIAQMARYHSLAALLTLLALYYFTKLFFKIGKEKSNWYLFLIFSVLTGWTDYPHFIYLQLICNGFYFYQLVIKKQALVKLKNWFIGEIAAAASFLPMVYLLYVRIVYEGDRSFGDMNILGNGIKSLIAAFGMHFYAYFFSENILPWNWLAFGFGSLVLVAGFTLTLTAWRNKKTNNADAISWFYLFSFIFANVLFMNWVDPRYNFIVYPKYGFVAFPLFITALVSCVRFHSQKLRVLFFASCLAVNLFGLYNFYHAQNYLNASYFNNFSGFAFVRDNAAIGDYLILNGNANDGVYAFYKDKYFSKLIPLPLEYVSSSVQKAKDRLWFFTTASDGGNTNNSTDSTIPSGFKIVLRHDTVPLDPVLRKYKQKITGYSSYIYKYSVFLLEKK